MAQGYLPTGAKAQLMDLHWFRPTGNYYSSTSEFYSLQKAEKVSL